MSELSLDAIADSLNTVLADGDPRINFCLDTAELGLWELDLATGFVSTSPHHERIFGYDAPLPAWTNTQFMAHVVPEDRERLLTEMRRNIQAGTQINTQTRIQRVDGTIRWIEIRGRAVRDAEGAPLRVVGTTRDITDHKRLEDALKWSEAHYRTLTESVPTIALMATPEGGCQYLNQRWYEYTGLTEAESLGRGWTRAIHPDDLDRTLREWRESADRGSFDIEYRFRGTDGAYRWHLGRIVPVRDDEGITRRYFGTLTDIDRQKRTEDELRAQQQEVDALNIRLRRAMQETHHRVKNNLQVINALIEVQRDQVTEATSITALNRVSQHVRALAAIHDLLTIQAKTDADLTHLSTQPLLHKLLGLIGSTLEGRRLHTHIEDIPLSIKDGAALGLLINELISNAVKHGRQDITLDLRQQGDYVRLEVRDDGQGFPVGFNARTAANTGLELVESVARWDLRGEAVYGNHEQGGAQVVVTFPLQS